ITIELILLPGLRIENLNCCAIIVSRRGKIAVPFLLCWHCRKRIVRIAPARPVPSAEKEPFVSAIEYLRNVQRPANVDAETRLVVIRLRRLNAGQRIWPRVQPRIVVGEKQHPMRLIDVEALRHSANHDHSAAWPAKTAAIPASKATPACALHAIAKFLDPSLQILLRPAS